MSNQNNYDPTPWLKTPAEPVFFAWLLLLGLPFLLLMMIMSKHSM